MAKSTKTKTGKNSPASKLKNSKNTELTKGSDPALVDLFTDSIKDIYWAENHLLKAIPKMIKAAASKTLAAALTHHLEVTRTHVLRLEQVFELLGKKIQAKKCDAMEGLSKEGEGIIEDTDKGTSSRDVGIIMASQKVEHYEIATYGSLVALAKTLGMESIAGLLTQTLNEEKESDETLTAIALNDINYAAATE